jgi:putative oxidoreductase
MSRPFPLARWSPQLLSVLRIVAAALFLSHGTLKLFGFPATPGQPPFSPPMGSLPWIGGVLETFGGVLLLLGLFTRPVAFLLSGEMAVAYFMMHAPHGSWPLVNGGEAAVLFCFIWLYFAAAGPGPWSVDAARRRGAS